MTFTPGFQGYSVNPPLRAKPYTRRILQLKGSKGLVSNLHWERTGQEKKEKVLTLRNGDKWDRGKMVSG